jgi:ubiquinone/menaquinone biosynthesis C-methylase UbiE
MYTNISRLPDEMRNLSNEAWLELLIKSISNQNIDGIQFPGFPPPEVQIRFVGGSYQQTLQEAFQFYQYVKSQAVESGKPLVPSARFLDFGCGWGRFLRFFWKDIEPENLFGCDVLPLAIDICRSTGIPGNLDLIEPEGKLPYPDNYFDFIIAYSVFTHLPERMNLHWMRELARVSRPGCIFCLTLEPRSFIDRIVNVSPDSDNAWLRSLSKYAPLAEELYRKFDSGEIAYLPTGGGDILTTEVYGDAFVPLAYIQKNWSPHFAVKAYIDDPTQFWQAVLVVQRNDL